MQLQLTPELEAKLKNIASSNGQAVDALVETIITEYFDDLAETKTMLDSRYDEIKSGRAQLIDGEEAFARLHERIDARRNRPA